jgi:uncharacterized protein YegP (UPF0339 family)
VAAGATRNFRITHIFFVDRRRPRLRASSWIGFQNCIEFETVSAGDRLPGESVPYSLICNHTRKSMPAHFDLKRSGAQFMFNLTSGHGEIVLTSERYTSKQSAQGGIASVKLNAPNDARYRRVTAKNGMPYFTLASTNGEVIGTSETYSSTAARETGVSSVKVNAPGASIVDNT